MGDGTGRRQVATVLAVVILLGLAGCHSGDDVRPVPPVTTSPTSSPVTSAAGPSAPVTSVPPQSWSVVRPDGIGDLVIQRDVLDLSVSDLEEALDAVGEAFLAPQGEDCGLAVLERQGIAAVTDSDLAITALVLQTDTVRTARGIGLGSSTQDVVAAYGAGAVAVLDDRESPTGGPILVIADEARPDAVDATSLHLAFETDADGLVTRLRAGHAPAVALGDYCSAVADHPERVGWPLEP